MTQLKLRIDGMHCGACVRRVTQALVSTEGVVVDEVRVGEVRLSSSQDPAPVDRIVAALAKAGYSAHVEP